VKSLKLIRQRVNDVKEHIFMYLPGSHVDLHNSRVLL
jgi:hypothetical protein